MSKPKQKTMLPYTEEQWQWVERKFREGYFIYDIAAFLGVSRETVRRNLQRRGIKPAERENMEPLNEFRDEFNRLGELR